MSLSLGEAQAPPQSGSGISTTIVWLRFTRSEMTMWKSRSVSCLYPTSRARTRKVVSSGALGREVSELPLGALTATNSPTVFTMGLKFTFAASLSVSVFTGHRSSPQFGPQLGSCPKAARPVPTKGIASRQTTNIRK